MESSVRYGQEADILLATKKITPEEYWPIQSLGTIVMRFSRSLKALPYTTEFRTLLTDHQVAWRLPETPLINVVYIDNDPPLTPELVEALAEPIMDLADDYSNNHDGIVFVDHSRDPLGIVLADRV